MRRLTKVSEIRVGCIVNLNWFNGIKTTVTKVERDNNNCNIYVDDYLFVPTTETEKASAKVIYLFLDENRFLEENDCYIDDENIVSDIMKVINMRKLRYC